MQQHKTHHIYSTSKHLTTNTDSHPPACFYGSLFDSIQRRRRISLRSHLNTLRLSLLISRLHNSLLQTHPQIVDMEILTIPRFDQCPMMDTFSLWSHTCPWSLTIPALFVLFPRRRYSISYYTAPKFKPENTARHNTRGLLATSNYLHLHQDQANTYNRNLNLNSDAKLLTHFPTECY